MATPLISFEASYIPRFEGSENSQRQIENLCAQRTFWSAIQELLSSGINVGTTSDFQESPTVEFCLIAEPDNRRNRIVINIRNVVASKDSVQSMANALPPDYGWRTLSHSSPVFDTQQNRLPTNWQIARIERRLNFVDLPWRLLDTLDTAGIQGNMAAVSQNSSWTSWETQQRRLITRPITRGELESERLCLPVSGALEIDPRSLRVFFQELRAQAPCVVSISLAAIDPERFDSYRRIAMFWGAHLQPFGEEIANAGFANLLALRSQYDRFLLPDRFLCIMTMQVAAANAIAARSVALHVSARLGGLRSFTIRDPAQVPLQSLGDPWNDVPHRTRWTQERWNNRRDRFHREAARDGIESHEIEPLFEEFLIDLPHLYTIDEAAAIASLPVADEEGLPGLDTRLIAPFSEPSRMGAYPASSEPPIDRLRIGIAVGQGTANLSQQQTPALTNGEWHTIAPKDLTKHAFVVGSTGSGKTVTTLFLVRELARLKIPFLIIEPVKTEYFSQLHNISNLNLRRVRLEGTKDSKQVPDFLAFDPMRLQPGVSVARHASYLKSCFEAAFPLEPVLAMILDAGIRDYYTDQTEWGCKLNIFSRGGPHAHRKQTWSLKDKKEIQVVQPSLKGFRNFFLKKYLPQIVTVDKDQPKLAELRELWVQYFKRRFDALDSGMIGIAARNADKLFLADKNAYDPFSTLLSGPTVLELDGVPDDEHKALMMAFIMTFLFERRQADDLDAREQNKTPSDDLRHVLIVEEAHRILTNSANTGRGENAGMGAQAKSVSLFVDMLAEIRAFGQGLIIVEQIPTKIVPEAVKNTNLKIMLRLTAADDREFLGAAMNFTNDQKRFVTSLRAESGRGVDMVVFEQQLDQPRLLTLPLPKNDGKPIHAGLFVIKNQEKD